MLCAGKAWSLCTLLPLSNHCVRREKKGRQTAGPCPFQANAIGDPGPDPVVMVPVLVDIMDVDTDTPVIATADPAPTVVVSPPVPTTATGADCGTKMRLRLESAATECEPDDCGMVSIRTLVLSITPSTAAWVAAVGQGAVVLQFLLEPCSSACRPC